MKGHFYKPRCICPKDKKCKCNATWSYIIDVGINPLTGKRKQKKKGGFKTLKEAEAAAALLQVEVSQGTHVEESNITFGEFRNMWLKMYASTGKVKVSTVRVREHESGRLNGYFEHLKLKSITLKKYQDALNDLKNEVGLAESTLDGIHSTGSMIFGKAMELGYIKKDPTQYAHVPKIQKTVEELEEEETLEKYLEKEELALFLQTAKTKGLERDYIIFKLLSYTGMRAGELCALKWKDIDFEECTINISRTYYNPKNNIVKYILLTPKTKTSKRKIDVDEGLIKDLEQHRAFQNEVRMRFRNTYYDHDFVIAKTKKLPGYPEYIKTIENRMERLLKLAELNESLTPHSLRHTHVSLLAEAGVGLKEIMDRLGHKDDDTTEHVYWHVTKPKKKEAPQKFAELMKGL
ncbi:tyrosine-type recombinase/integrase [Paenibacillus polymyxa]|uniref:tyrosine-type recombinase/integrase n=1 Tax=Paenibacillus polymyxa TaxID=1406 RepID=UPI000402AE14|nr:site-specific integrase [Paenibacillus polymyxa]